MKATVRISLLITENGDLFVVEAISRPSGKVLQSKTAKTDEGADVTAENMKLGLEFSGYTVRISDKR